MGGLAKFSPDEGTPSPPRKKPCLATRTQTEIALTSQCQLEIVQTVYKKSYRFTEDTSCIFFMGEEAKIVHGFDQN